MYWVLSLDDFLLGYGHYRDSDGSTFMSTDAGYMRNILFFGFGGALYLGFIQIYNLYMIYNMNKNSSVETVFFITLTSLIFILHYKGEIFLHLVSVQTILCLTFFTSLLFKNKG